MNRRNVQRSVAGRWLLLWAAAMWFGCGGGDDNHPAPPTATATATIQVPTATPVPGPAGPGIAASITDATIDSAGHIVVAFTLTDANGGPLTVVLTATQNDSQARVRLTIAHAEDYNGGGELGQIHMFTRYVNEINAVHPAFDSKGTLIALSSTTYQYTFGTQLPAGFDPTHTYTIGMQVDRTVNGVRIGVNPIFDVVPAGGTPEILESTTTQQCNSCHDPLIAHGNRREVRLCMLCHAEAATDNPPAPTPARSIDFRNMIHKIHRGKDLPSIVNGPSGVDTTYTIGNTVFAEKDPTGNITGVGFPRNIEGCLVCHSDGPTASYYKDRPAAAACASCHDDVNPSMVDTPAGPPGTNHFQSKGYADGDCAFCHVSDSGSEFDISVVGAHTIPEFSKQLHGLNLNITGLTNHQAGQTPTITFQLTDGAGNPFSAADVATLDRVGFAISGPSTDYTVMITPTAIGGGSSGTLVGPDATGTFQYTPATGIPASATGTWAIGAEARRPVQLTVSQDVSPKTAEEAAANPVVTFTVDDSVAAPRRIVVDNQHCGACHGTFSKDFSVHGNLRNSTEYCPICHNPNQNDGARRKSDPAAVARGDQTASIDFKRMLHKIHTGIDLENKPYIIYGFGPPPPAGQGFSINDFSDVRFPGDRRNCAKCHVDTTYLMPPFPGTALGTLVTHLDPATGNQVVDGHLGPIRSVCTACHDGDDVAAHAETQTAPDGTEACPVCHQEGAAFAVSVMHAR